MPSQNVIMLQTVANGLSELTEELVFVGAAVAELYSDDPAASDIRPTQDVDCVIELSSRIEHNKLEVRLQVFISRWFHNFFGGTTRPQYTVSGKILYPLALSRAELFNHNLWPDPRFRSSGRGSFL